MTDEQTIAIMAAILATSPDHDTDAIPEAIALFREVRMNWRSIEGKAMPQSEWPVSETGSRRPRWYEQPK